MERGDGKRVHGLWFRIGIFVEPMAKNRKLGRERITVVVEELMLSPEFTRVSSSADHVGLRATPPPRAQFARLHQPHR